jgi:hypothetical protein
MRRRPPTPGGSPMGEAFSLHTMDALSMNSMVDGTIFAATMAETVSAASSTSLNRARIVAFVSGMGMSFRITFVMTPNVPSLPTKSLVRSYPTTPFMVLTPRLSISPVASTTSMPST